MNKRILKRLGIVFLTSLTILTALPTSSYATHGDLDSFIEDIFNNNKISPSKGEVEYTKVIDWGDTALNQDIKVTRRILSQLLYKQFGKVLGEIDKGNFPTLWNDVPPNDPDILPFTWMVGNHLEFDKEYTHYKPEFIMTVGEVSSVLQTLSLQLNTPITISQVQRGIHATDNSVLGNRIADVGIVSTMIYNVGVFTGLIEEDAELKEHTYDKMEDYLVFGNNRSDIPMYDLQQERFLSAKDIKGLPQTFKEGTNRIQVLYYNKQIVAVLESTLPTKIGIVVDNMRDRVTLGTIKEKPVLLRASNNLSSGLKGSYGKIITNPYNSEENIGYFSQLGKAYYITDRSEGRLFTHDGGNLVIGDWKDVYDVDGKVLSFKDIKEGDVLFVDNTEGVLLKDKKRVETQHISNVIVNGEGINITTSTTTLPPIKNPKLTDNFSNLNDTLKDMPVEVVYSSRGDIVHTTLPIHVDLSIVRRYDESNRLLEVETLTGEIEQDNKGKPTPYTNLQVTSKLHNRVNLRDFRNRVVFTLVTVSKDKSEVHTLSEIGHKTISGNITNVRNRYVTLNKANHRIEDDTLVDIDGLAQGTGIPYKEFYERLMPYLKYHELKARLVVDEKGNVNYMLVTLPQYKVDATDRDKIVKILNRVRINDDLLLSIRSGDEELRVIAPYNAEVFKLTGKVKYLMMYLSANSTDKGFVEAYDIFEPFWDKRLLDNNLTSFDSVSDLKSASNSYISLNKYSFLDRVNSRDSLYKVETGVGEDLKISSITYTKLQEDILAYKMQDATILEKLQPLEEQLLTLSENKDQMDITLTILQAELMRMEHGLDDPADIANKKTEINGVKDNIVGVKEKIVEVEKEKSKLEDDLREQNKLPYDHIIKIETGNLELYRIY